MAALVTQAGIQASRLQAAVPATASIIHHVSYSTSSDNIHTIKNPSLSAMKRGTGGRSSFSGIVATVFGASGLLGNHVANRLGKIGSQIIIPYRGDHYDVLRLKLVGDLGQVLFVPFNLRDDESIYKAVKYSNVVINLIGRDWETKNFTFDDVNVEGAARVARISKEAGVEKLIWISDLNAAEKPKGHVLKGGSKHLASKWKGEIAVRKEFPEAIIFKPSFIMMENSPFLSQYTSFLRHSFNALPMWKKGEQTIKQPVYGYDLAAGIIQAIKDKDAAGKTYQAIGPKRYRLSDLVDWFHAEMLLSQNPGDYWRSDLSKDFLFQLLVTLNEKIAAGLPVGNVHWEMLERESVTDNVDPNLPTLEDLGIALTPMEEYVSWLLRPFKDYGYYDAELNEFSKAVPPKPVTC